MEYGCRREDSGQGVLLGGWCLVSLCHQTPPDSWTSPHGIDFQASSGPGWPLVLWPDCAYLLACCCAAPPLFYVFTLLLGQDQWSMASRLLLSSLVPEARGQLSRWFPGVFTISNHREWGVKMTIWGLQLLQEVLMFDLFNINVLNVYHVPVTVLETWNTVMKASLPSS